MKTYTTIAGDKWDSVAYKTLGDCGKMDILIKENIEHRETYIFPAGIVLGIPELPAEESDGLPPWKEGGEDES